MCGKGRERKEKSKEEDTRKLRGDSGWVGDGRTTGTRKEKFVIFFRKFSC